LLGWQKERWTVDRVEMAKQFLDWLSREKDGKPGQRPQWVKMAGVSDQPGFWWRHEEWSPQRLERMVLVFLEDEKGAQPSTEDIERVALNAYSLVATGNWR
jgi:hypothetical protein